MDNFLQSPSYGKSLGMDMLDQAPQQAAQLVYNYFPTNNPVTNGNVDRANRVKQYMTSAYLSTQEQQQVLEAKKRSREYIMRRELLETTPYPVQILQDKMKAIKNTYLGLGQDNQPYVHRVGRNFLETFAPVPGIFKPKGMMSKKLMLGGGALLLFLWWRNRA